MFPVNRLNVIKHKFDPPPFSYGVSNSVLASHPACNSEGESDGTVVNIDCFSGYDPSIHGNIDPDINYLNSNNKVNDTPIIYFIEFIHEVYRYTNININTVISNIKM